ncbi:Fc.00g071190.m01.CDS01 [Cosmosporella sp. VM-42]
MTTIREIIRRHPRESLFVQPLEWTSRQLELMQCSFEEIEYDPLEENMSVQLDFKRNRLSSDYYARIAESLPTSDTKNGDIGNILAGPDGPLQRQDFFGFLRYGPGKDQKARLHGGTFGPMDCKPKDNKSPTFAFLQRDMIEFQRTRLFPMPRSNRPGHQPWTRVRDIRLKRITPSDRYQDPLIAAVLIGLAQSQAAVKLSEYDNSKYCPKDLESRIYRVCALLVDDDEACMRLYTSEISAAFLAKFEYPEALARTAELPESSPMSIRYGKVTYKPYSTFRQRLLRELVPNSNKDPQSKGT